MLIGTLEIVISILVVHFISKRLVSGILSGLGLIGSYLNTNGFILFVYLHLYT